MKNNEISKILREISEYLEMQDIPFKPRAYEKASLAIKSLGKETEKIYEAGGLKALEKIPEVGVSIAEKIKEMLKTGRLGYYEKLKKETPVELNELTRVEGLGPKNIKKLYQELRIKNLKDLEKAAKSGKIRNLENFGEKSEEKILKGIEFLKKSGKRFILGFIEPEIHEIEERLKKLKDVQKIAITGSVRRKKETIGNVDILVISKNPKPVMDFFVAMPEVIYIYAHGQTKSAVKLKNGLDMDLRIMPEQSYCAALNYFTGSKEHNVALRKIALKKGCKLNEYGLFKNQKSKRKNQNDKLKCKNNWLRIANEIEEEIYKVLGLDYIEPELRENTGEIEAAEMHKLPLLIEHNDLKGDLQTHTKWSEGIATIEQMAEQAIKIGLEYIAITDHTKSLAITHGLDEKKIQEQWEKIDEINSKFKARNSKFRILKGVECDILKDGSLDLPDKILAKCDIVGASIHSNLKLPKQEQTKRIKKAMANPNVDIIFHPTGRIINRRPEYALDIDEIIRYAKQTKTMLEINAYPERLDLKDENIKKCIKAGVKMSIGSDAHSPEHFSFLKYGIAQARRGWAEKKDIINTLPVKKMLKMLK